MGKREGKVEQALVERIGAIGGIIRKSMWISRRGCPDRRVMLPEAWRQRLAATLGVACQNPWVEVKAPGQVLEDHQEREIKRMRDLGELVLVIDCQDDIDHWFPWSLR